MAEEGLIRDREEALRLRISRLSDKKKQIYFRDLSHSLKDPDTYAVLNWFFVAGLHHFYLGRHAKGGFLLTGWLASFILIFVTQQTMIAGIVLILIIFAIELPALFKSQQIVKLHNLNIREQALENISNDPGAHSPEAPADG